MKRLIVLAVLTLTLTACTTDIPVTPMSEALKISTFLYPEEISNSIDYHNATLDELQALDDTGIEFARLELGKERMIAREGYNNTVGLNFRIEYEGGSVELISENKDVQMSVDEKCRLMTNDNARSERHFGYDIRISNSGYVALVPLGGCGGMTEIDNISVFGMRNPRYPGPRGAGTEYYIKINAYEGGSTTSPKITAELKFTHLGISDADPYYSDFCAVELISYDYSDAYKIMEAEQ